MAVIGVTAWILFLFLSGLPFNTTQQQVQARSDEDLHFEEFLYTKLYGYNEWLSHRDPLPPIAGPVYLNTTLYGIDANFTITNYYMSNHSTAYNNIYELQSQLDSELGRTFTIKDQHFYIDSYLTFGGDYTLNGTILLEGDSGVKVPFHGEGKWSLGALSWTNSIVITNYTVTKDDYVDLDSSLANGYSYNISIAWDAVGGLKFEGLTLNEEKVPMQASALKNRTANDDLIFRIQLVLAETYERFLAVQGFPIEQQPAKRVLVEYLKETFSKTTFSDIKAGLGIITSTSTTPSQNGSKASYGGLGIQIFLIFGSLIVGMKINVLNLASWDV